MVQRKARLSEIEIAETRRKALALRARIAQVRSRQTVSVDADLLKKFLLIVERATTQTKAERSIRIGKTPGINGLSATEDEITPQQAATILKMSRPSVMRLIANGHLHPRKVMSRNKLSRAEVMAFHERSTREQRQALQNLSSLSEEFDF